MIYWQVELVGDHYYKKKEGYVSSTEIEQIVQASKYFQGPTAKISHTVQRATDYGGVKVASTVSIECPQDKAWMDVAARLTFSYALEYCNDGFSYLAPQEPRIEGPK
jgi:hypothetical protein